MSTDLLCDLISNAMHCPTTPALKASIWNAYMSIHSHRRMSPLPLLTLNLLGFCIF